MRFLKQEYMHCISMHMTSVSRWGPYYSHLAYIWDMMSEQEFLSDKCTCFFFRDCLVNSVYIQIDWASVFNSCFLSVIICNLLPLVLL
jgi:hypothetical protein